MCVPVEHAVLGNVCTGRACGAWECVHRSSMWCLKMCVPVEHVVLGERPFHLRHQRRSECLQVPTRFPHFTVPCGGSGHPTRIFLGPTPLVLACKTRRQRPRRMVRMDLAATGARINTRHLC
eukprot:gene13338-biopygen17020